MTTVNKQAIRSWVKKLESGKFTQIRRKLYQLSDDKTQIVGHCCLAVACEVYLDAQGVKTKKARVARMKRWTGGTLPLVVRKFFGISNDPRLNGARATKRNDDNRNTFKTIAKHARKEFLK